MVQKNLFEQLPQALLPWYHENKRDLPWREDKEPYHIWLSEIMLQQTRVEAVKGYYLRFLKAVPTVEDLAAADDEQLHKLWEGLGYYSRVRNLKKAAQAIVNAFGGVFPREYVQVISLPGIGEYTAGAICSIAFDQPTPAVDGNVMRVIARITNNETPVDLPAYKKLVRQELCRIYPAQAGDFTQALMELGATICGPDKKPDCRSCPCNGFCLALLHETTGKVPVRLPKRSRKLEKKTVLILSCDGLYAVQKRSELGLLADMWQFPNVEGKLDLAGTLATVENMGLRTKEIQRQVEKKHVFTHVEWDMFGYYIEVVEPGADYVWLSADQINNTVALPTAFRQFWIHSL